VLICCAAILFKLEARHLIFLIIIIIIIVIVVVVVVVVMQADLLTRTSVK